MPAARAEAEPEPPRDPVAAAEAVQRDTDIINLATEVRSSSRPLPPHGHPKRSKPCLMSSELS